MTSKKKVRVAIVGVGNCASSLVQGVQYYREAKPEDFVPGLMHVNLGGYHISDIEFSAAFDIDQNKVGKDLSEAVFVSLCRSSSTGNESLSWNDTRWVRQIPLACDYQVSQED
jgi:myo-inositol-1-phosphate synthase